MGVYKNMLYEPLEIVEDAHQGAKSKSVQPSNSNIDITQNNKNSFIRKLNPVTLWKTARTKVYAPRKPYTKEETKLRSFASTDLDLSKVIVFDTETTGLKAGRDEILQLSIVDGHGNTLFDQRFQPVKRKTWKAAEEIHGISPKDVKGCPHIYDFENEITRIFDNASLIVGYNIEFDLQFLRSVGMRTWNYSDFCMMKYFSKVYGEWSSWKHDWKWQKLTTCAKYYEYPQFAAHSSLEDAKATAYCFRKAYEQEKNLSVLLAAKKKAKWLLILEIFILLFAMSLCVPKQ